MRGGSFCSTPRGTSSGSNIRLPEAGEKGGGREREKGGGGERGGGEGGGRLGIVRGGSFCSTPRGTSSGSLIRLPEAGKKGGGRGVGGIWRWWGVCCLCFFVLFDY